MADLEKHFGQTYTILDEIGSGGGGTVYKAYHQRLKKEVALKKIHNNLTDINARMETDILKNVRHSYLPQVIDFLELPDGIYTVMDFIDGVSLAQVLQKNSWVPEKEVIKWFRQLCQALEVLHNQPKPVLHGDIKPANIMLQRNGNICLIDFNIASIYEGSRTIISGYTPGYAAPEQIEYLHRNVHRNENTFGHNTVSFEQAAMSSGMSTGGDTTSQLDQLNELQTIIDVRTDIYNMGATIFHLLTGQKPVTSDRTYYAVEELNPNISPTLCHIVNKCIAPNRDDRYQNVTEVLQALDNMYLSDSRYIKLIRTQRIKRVFLVIGTILFTAIAAYGGVLMSRDHSKDYAKQINVMTRASEQMNESALDKAFERAVDLDRTNYEAYEIKAQYLYDIHRYDECKIFITEIAMPELNEGEGTSNLNYIIGSCYMAEDDYEEAIEYISDAIEQNPDNGILFSDYAVCAAKLGDLKTAEKQLKVAIKRGIKDDAINYTEGEIHKAKKEYDEAFECFEKSIKKTKDEHTKLRGYMALIEMASENRTEPSLIKALEYCDKAIEDLEENKHLAINEYRAQILVDLGKETGNKDYYYSAIEAFNKLIDDGYGTFKTHMSRANLYDEIGEYETEEKLLNDMLNIYGEDYRIYMTLAFMEVKVQNAKDENSRNYSAFKVYAEKAEELYRNSNADDDNMVMLRNLYNQAKDGDWF